MNELWLRSFLIVADNGSVTKAAKILYITPQALLQQINFLEKRVDIILFNRSKKGVSLTNAGKRFYDGIKEVLSSYDQLLIDCRKLDSNKRNIRIPISTSLAKPKFVETICDKYKEINMAQSTDIEFIETQTVIYSWMDGLMNKEFDIIEYYTIDGFHPEEIHFEKFYDVKTWCLLSKDHPKANNTVISPKDLHGQEIATFYKESYRYLQAYLEHVVIKARFKEIPIDFYKIQEACRAGMICFVSEAVVNIIPNVVCKPLDFDCHIHSGLACRSDEISLFNEFFEVARKVCGGSY